MTPKEREAMQQALEALSKCYPSDEYNAVIDALREALADTRSSIRSSIRSTSEYSEQEPVAWMSPGKERLEFSRKDTVYGSHTIPLYAHTGKPIAKIAGDYDGLCVIVSVNDADLPPEGTFLYAAPVRTKDLTDWELAMAMDCLPTDKKMMDSSREAIAADREKNK